MQQSVDVSIGHVMHGKNLSRRDAVSIAFEIFGNLIQVANLVNRVVA